MPQPQPQTLALSQAHVQWTLSLLYADADTWEQQYWERRWQETAKDFEATYPTFDFKYEDRHQFYRFINCKILEKAPVDYLEFGVAGGSSFCSWMQLNSCEQSRFFGFDSFEGLPEHWHANAPKGAYSTQGNIPSIDDPRGTFLKGMFQETLPEFAAAFEPNNRLVLHMDADLYSSTLYVLTMLDRFIAPGTIILFDEFLSKKGSHEFAALYDYSRAYYRKWNIVAARKDKVKLAIEIL